MSPSPVRTKIDFLVSSVSVVLGANLGFSHKLINLTDLVDSLGTADGSKGEIQSIKLKYLFRSDDPFICYPVVMQSAGTWTDQNNLTERVLADMVDQAIDDEVGTEIYKSHLSTIGSVLDPTSASGQYTLYYVKGTWNCPKKVINLLNKETQTERLQKLAFCVVGVGRLTSQQIHLFSAYEVNFRQVRKELVIR